MKLADDSLLMLVEIFRRGVIELKDISQDLRDLDLVENKEGKLTLLRNDQENGDWTQEQQAETD
jgi:hypothetical protein